MEEAKEVHHSVPHSFHRAVSPTPQRRYHHRHHNLTSSCQSSPSRRFDGGEYDQQEQEQEQEQQQRLLVTPMPPFSITSYGDINTGTFVRLPSVHLPSLDGSSSSRTFSYRRHKNSTNTGGGILGCICSYIPTVCKLLLCLVPVLVYCRQVQVGGWRTFLNLGTATDDDGGGFGPSWMVRDEPYEGRPPSIRGDYSTVTNVDDVLTFAANVPVACFHQRRHCHCEVTTSSSSSSSSSSSNNKTYLDVDRWTFPGRPSQQHVTNSSSTRTPSSIATSLNSRINPIPGNLNGWLATHQNNKLLAQSNNATRATVVFYGDSITERWQGTRLGMAATTDIQGTGLVFDRLFRNGGDVVTPEKTLNDVTVAGENDPIANLTIMEGLPLGIAGDTTPNLLWRIQNGELPSNINPRIFVVLIGTNDLGRDWCSAENIVVGIVRVVEELLQQRPHATILLHGLLPRTFHEEGYLYHGDTSNTGGQRPTSKPFVWEALETVNDELQRYARYRMGVIYFNTDVFFKDLPQKRQINMDLMPDGLHPSVLGYELWGADLKVKILEILEQRKLT